MDGTYVIGHLNPDLDSIASALGYAWLLREKRGIDATPARAGGLNPQTVWVLNQLGLEAPLLLTDASPRFGAVSRRFDTLTSDMPLRDAWKIANRTGGIAPVVNQDGTPYGLVTGWSMFEFLSQVMGPTPPKETDVLSRLLETSCAEACSTNVPVFQANGRIRDSLNRILRLEDNDFFVVDEEGRYLGIARQRDLLNPPRIKLILVDHNEQRQAIGSLNEAELLEILDHHRLDNPSTHTPIRFSVDVVGSTSTLVSERIEDAGMSAPPEIAGVLLAGVFSDTLTLTSPTTTERDHRAAERLGRWAFVSGAALDGETLESFGQQVISAGAGLESRAPEEIVNTDMKRYEAGSYKFSIAQAEVTKYIDSESLAEELKDALEQQRDKNGLDFSLLMITNVVRGSSRLMFSEPLPIMTEIPYPLMPDGTYNVKGVVSRKKQLLPVLLGIVE
ncbi:MAG: DHHA2 domain-containing protein [Chloroflexota bacterium]